MTEAKAASEEGYHLTLALAFSDKASYRASGAQGLDRCATRATGPDQVANSISTAWAALTADVPVLHSGGRAYSFWGAASNRGRSHLQLGCH